MVENLNLQGNQPKTYFPASWLSDKSVPGDEAVSCTLLGLDKNIMSPYVLDSSCADLNVFSLYLI